MNAPTGNLEMSSMSSTREAVIIAAGWGSRLRDVSECKPLTRIDGFSLLEIGVTQLALAGIRRVVVVTGYRASEMEAALPGISKRTGVDLCSVRIEDWTRPNGLSVIAGGRACAGNYLLVMADHILSGRILIELIRSGGRERGVTLAIDKQMDSPLIDPDDATYVRVDRLGRILSIGKHLPEPHAVDCGAFLATPELADAIEDAIRNGAAGSLSDGMQVLANRGRAFVMDIGNAWWIDVDDPKALSMAQRGFRQNMPHFALKEGGNSIPAGQPMRSRAGLRP